MNQPAEPPDSVAIGPHSLRMPPGMTGLLLSESPHEVEAFVTSSPDHTIYHRQPYIEFARAQNGFGDVLLVRQNGQPRFAVPLHPAGHGALTTGYSGLLFSPGESESGLRRGVEAVRAFFDANRGIAFHAVQAAVAESYEDPARMTMISRLFDALQVSREPLYSRVVDLPGSQGAPREGQFGTRPLESFDESLLGGYDGDVRNQIRQAGRKGLRISFVTAGSDAERLATYERYVPIHQASWNRTGMSPHEAPYWLDLAKAVTDGGGHDLVVFAETAEGEAVAGVTCHLYGARAIYWSACSTTVGRSMRANPFCLHGAMCLCAELGVTRLELGRFTADEANPKERSITDYKAQFGGRLYAVPTLRSPGSLAHRADGRLRTLVKRTRRGY